MSKTDKTRPYWVKTLDAYEKDRYVEHDHLPISRYRKNPNTGRIERIVLEEARCDFDPQSSTLYHRGGVTYRDHDVRCGWNLPYYYRWGFRYCRPPTNEDRHFYYYDRERAAVRTSNRMMARDWNANGNDFNDDIAITDQHRHARWRSGWWD